MMKYYIELTLLPDAEVGLGFLWQKVYQQIHLALVEVKDENEKVNIGVSFPKYGDRTFPLGNAVRLFARTAGDLEVLHLERWLDRFSDYVAISAITEVPQKLEGHACFSRRQFKSNAQRLARRQAKRQGITLEEAMKNYESMQEQTTQLPFIVLHSLSTGSTLKLFLQKDLKEVAAKGDFNTYGLSKGATVPCF